MDDFTPQGDQKDTPITIASAAVAELTTRATISNDNLEGGSIGIFVNSPPGDRYMADNIKWTYSNDGWDLEDATVCSSRTMATGTLSLQQQTRVFTVR